MRQGDGNSGYGGVVLDETINDMSTSRGQATNRRIRNMFMPRSACRLQEIKRAATTATNTNGVPRNEFVLPRGYSRKCRIVTKASRQNRTTNLSFGDDHHGKKSENLDLVVHLGPERLQMLKWQVAPTLLHWKHPSLPSHLTCLIKREEAIR